MTLGSLIAQIARQEDVNFLLTNRIPRRRLTTFIGWFSKIETPPIPWLSIAVWRLFCDIDLSDARETRFRSMHTCFTRRLKDGSRPIDPDPDILVSPCDAIIGAAGRVENGRLFQIKGFSYALQELLGNGGCARPLENGLYVTLRLTSGMYHRFHAPHDCHVEGVTYISGDTWNVNPIALKRVDRLFCRNARAVINVRLHRGDHHIVLVPVAAILVSGIRLNFMDASTGSGQQGAGPVKCNVALRKGAEMGWFEHGSTIIVFAPENFTLCDNVREGCTIRVGQPLLRLPPLPTDAAMSR